jgi:hypothetical protein
VGDRQRALAIGAATPSCDALHTFFREEWSYGATPASVRSPFLEGDPRLPLRRASILAALALVAFASHAAASCGSESCLLDNALGVGAHKFSLELSYQYVDQDQLKRGSEDVDPAELLIEGGEVRTRSRVTTVNSYAALSPRWLVSASIPFVDRLHQHVVAQDVPEPEMRTWEYSGLGDMTVSTTWTVWGALTPLSLSLQGGVKLPTGRRHVPEINGEEPEPHARPGTGSTDLLGGLQIVKLLQLPLLSRAGTTTLFASGMVIHTGYGTDDYRVGRMIDGHLGLTQPIISRLSLVAQCNVRDRAQDDVKASETTVVHAHAGLSALHETPAEGGKVENTGGTTLYVTPGMRFEVTPWLSFAGYAQVPVVQHLIGQQLVASTQFWMGATYRLP